MKRIVRCDRQARAGWRTSERFLKRSPYGLLIKVYISMHSSGNELEYGMVSRRDAKTIQIVVHPHRRNLNLSAVLSPCQAWGCGTGEHKLILQRRTRNDTCNPLLCKRPRTRRNNDQVVASSFSIQPQKRACYRDQCSQ